MCGNPVTYSVPGFKDPKGIHEDPPSPQKGIRLLTVDQN